MFGGAMATIKDVAARCGVAVSTVSRVVNGHPDVSEQTRDKVNRAIQELHYVPNGSARDLAQSQTDSIGVVVRGAENLFYSPIIRTMGQACEAAGFTMVLDQIATDADEVSAAGALAMSKRLRGVVLLGGRFDYTPEDATIIGVPFVCCTHANQFGTLDDDSYSSVSIDDVMAARQATEKLISLGHSKIAVLLDSVNDRSISELRYRGYCEALTNAGIEVDDELVALAEDYSMKAAYYSVRDLLRRREDVTAIFSISDLLAIAAMKALHDEGKTVPGDVSIISIDGIDTSLYTIPTLTTFEQPQARLGEQAIQILADTLTSGAPTRQVWVATTIRPGGTLAAL